MTPYNLAASVNRAHDAEATTLLDPGSGGTVLVHNKGLAILKLIVATGARTLAAATSSDVGDEVLVVSSVASASVNSVDVADGGYLLFRVTLDASGVNQWQLAESGTTNPALVVTRTTSAAAANLIPVSGGANRTLQAATPVALGTVDINTGDAATDAAIIALVNALTAYGLTTATWT